MRIRTFQTNPSTVAPVFVSHKGLSFSNAQDAFAVQMKRTQRAGSEQGNALPKNEEFYQHLKKITEYDQEKMRKSLRFHILMGVFNSHKN